MKGPFPLPSFQVLGPKGGQVPLRKAGTRNRCGLDTPPSQPGGGGRGTAAPPGRRGGEGSVRGLSRPGSGARPSPRGEGAGPLVSPRLWGPYACVRRRPASSRCTRCGGGSGGEAGRRKPTTKLASPSSRLDLNGRSPRPRSAAASRDSADGRRGAARGSRRYPARAAGWAKGSGPSPGGGLGLPAGSGRSPKLPRAGLPHPVPQVGALHRVRGRELHVGSATPPRSLPGQGPFLLSGQRLVPARFPPPLPAPVAHIWKESEGGGEGRGVGGRGLLTGNVGAGGTGEGRGPLYVEPRRESHYISSLQLVRPSLSSQRN